MALGLNCSRRMVLGSQDGCNLSAVSSSSLILPDISRSHSGHHLEQYKGNVYVAMAKRYVQTIASRTSILRSSPHAIPRPSYENVLHGYLESHQQNIRSLTSSKNLLSLVALLAVLQHDIRLRPHRRRRHRRQTPLTQHALP